MNVDHYLVNELAPLLNLSILKITFVNHHFLTPTPEFISAQTHRFTLLLLTSILFVFSISAQSKLVGMLQKYEQSTLVVEAEVVSKETVKCYDGLIYQKVKIELFQILKGIVSDTSGNYATVILRGGTLNGEQQQWNHNVDLPIGQRFIGFLTSYNTSCFEDITYRFYGGVQGKYYYDYDPMGLRIMCPGHSFGDPNKFYDRLSEVSNSTFEPQLDIDPSTKTMTCLELMFEVSIPNPLEPLNLDVLVSIRTSNESKLISKPVFSFNYDEDALGGNVGANGVVSLENLGISSHYNYESIIEDIAPDEIRISVDAIDLSEPDLILISNVYQPLMKVRLSLPSLLDPGVVLQEQTIIELSRYFDVEDNLEKHFDCVRVYGDIQSIFGGCTPSIFEIILINTYPTEKAAGVDRMMHINGECFGSGESVGHSLQFTNARNGFVNGLPEFVKAKDADILLWNDNNITFLIPSECEPPDNSTSLGYAGQGKVRVYPGELGQEDVFAESTQDLQIQFAWRNSYTAIPDPNPTQPDDVYINHSLPVYLVDKMSYITPGHGYYMYFDDNFPTEFKPAFIRALDLWRCSNSGSGINLQIVSIDTLALDVIDNSSRVYMDDLPVSVLSDGVLFSRTETYVNACEYESGGFQIMSVLNIADIVFNQNVNWHYTTNTNVDLSSATDADLESIALHELGHWQGLLHVNHETDIMYWTVTEDYNREITPFSFLGGTHIVEQSVNPEINATLLECVNFSQSPATMYSDCSFSSGTDSHLLSHSINLFPNPCNDYMYIEDLNLNNILNELIVINIFGSEVKRIHIRSPKTIIDVSDLSPGMYILMSNDNLWKSTFIIQR